MAQKKGARKKIYETQKINGDIAERRRVSDKQLSDWNPNSPTIEYAWSDFMVECMAKQLASASISFYQRFYKKYTKFLNEYIGANDENTPVDILVGNHWHVLFIKSMGDVSIQTVNSYLRAYRAFGNFCQKRGWIEGFECPIKEVEPPVKEVYTSEELERLLIKPNIEDFVAFRNYTIITLLLSTGARENTIINIRLADVDLENGFIAFNTTKANKVRNMPLEPKALTAISEFINRYRHNEVKPSDYLFCNIYGEQISRGGLAQSIATYNKSRGVEKTSIHLFRHTFAKNWITSGGDIITLAQVLTHSELDMVKRYANLYQTDIREKMLEYSTLSSMRVKSGKTLKTK